MGRGDVGELEPPASLLLVHGAGSGPWVFAGWDESFPSLEVETVDLHEGLDVAEASHADYAAAVVAAARRLPQPVALCGWSMGGLAALQAAERVRPHSLILLESSPSAEAGAVDETMTLARGTFDPEEVYGAFPEGMPARPESLRARAERKRGIAVAPPPCPVLVVSTDDFRDERGTALAELYGAEHVHLAGRGHWDLVRDPAARAPVASFLGCA